MYDMFRDPNPSEYGWIITKDLLFAESPDTFTSDVGTIGPSNITDEMMESLKNGEGRKFRMFDDDGELYYEGLVIGELVDGGDPLTDFGMPNAGATLYQEFVDGKWIDVIA